MDPVERLRAAEAAVKEAHCLLRAQEAEVARMRWAGLDVLTSALRASRALVHG